MKKLNKRTNTKYGFSLLETVLVLAIICILASGVIYGGLKILDTIKVYFA